MGQAVFGVPNVSVTPSLILRLGSNGWMDGLEASYGDKLLLLGIIIWWN